MPVLHYFQDRALLHLEQVQVHLCDKFEDITF